ncbi:MAG: hypothetical protein ACRDJE_08020 [Dehalococcoidia bacterium]
MERTSPYGRIARKVHEGPTRRGLRGMVQRMARAVVPRPEPLAVALIEAPMGESQFSRERARRALMEARTTMSGVIGETPVPLEVAESWPVQTVMPDLERLQRYLEESDRDREALRTEVITLRESVNALRAQLDHIGPLLAAPAATVQSGASDGEPSIATEQREADPLPGAPDGAPPALADSAERSEQVAETPPAEGLPEADSAEEGAPAGDEALRELRERVLRALHERTFAAGTVGTRVYLSPPPSAGELDRMVTRLDEEPPVEHAEVIETGDGAACVRVSLRTPLRWEQFSSLIERAIDQPLLQSEAAWSDGALHVCLSAGEGADGTASDDVTAASSPETDGA